jgi:abhydrolase domain-containing protein 12
LNFHITTSDNVTLGAWFVLSDTYYREVPFPEPPSYPSLEARIPLAIKARPTVLFFHGNAATRAAPYRVQYYKAFSSRLHANVLAIDYRGFGDSEGVPSESGLAADAHAAWDWLISNGANPENILIVGHSLGSAVAAKLSVDLADQGVTFKGLVLMSPFSSIRTLLEAYHFFGFLPLMKPLRMIPGLHGAFNSFLPLVWISVYVLVDFLTRPLAHTFDTLSAISVCNQTSIHINIITMSVQAIKAPILLVHAEDDWDIPYTHSETLFNALLEHLLPSIVTPPIGAATSWVKDDWDKFYAAHSVRTNVQKSLVASSEIPHFGTVNQFMRGKVDEGKVVFLKTIEGGHNKMGALEGVQEVIRVTFDFP